MAPWDLRFDAGDPADLEPMGGGVFRVRVHAEPGLVDGAAVVRSASGVVAHPLEPDEAGRFVQWSATLRLLTEPVGLSFAFRVAESGRPVYLVPSGTSSSVERLDRWWVDPAAAPVGVPEWAKGAVIYQIFPDRFARTGLHPAPGPLAPWDATPSPRSFHGGDLDGIVVRLDHLDRVGVDAIYLNPIFPSPSNHRYDTVDYRTVDPALGGEPALRRLVKAAHSRGMRVILDASFNHVHPRFFAFADLVEHGRKSPYRDWFVVRDWPPRLVIRPALLTAERRSWVELWRDQTGVEVEERSDDGAPVETTYEAWYGVPTMPRIDLSHPPARRHVLDVAAHWLSEFDVDGWRMDVARYVDRDFWPEFRAVCRAVKPDAYLLAEIMGDVSSWLRGDGFDATMNYTLRFLALGFLATADMDGREFLDHCARLYGRHALATTLANHNLIGSHDTPRFRTEAGGDLWRSELATVFQLTYPGAPGIYYGDELGLEGGGDPGCRGTMPWNDLPTGFVDTISAITSLRRRAPALRVGEWRPVAATSDAVAYERWSGRARYLVGINRGRRSASLAVEGQGTTVWGSGGIEGGLTVAGRSAVIVRR